MKRDRAKALLLAAAACACHACNRVPEPTRAAGNDPADALASPGLIGPQADINASLAFDPFDGTGGGPEAESATGALPPANTPLRFVGRWAPDRRQCAGAAWIFTDGELTTPAGAVCGFDHVRKVPGGYDIAARCTAEGPERADTIKLRFAESARAMLFESDSIADAGLAYCGE